LPLGASPTDDGLHYEDIAFLSKEGLQLKGWWVPGPDTGCERPPPVVILLHPLAGNRAGAQSRTHRGSALDSPRLDLLRVACSLWSAGFGMMLFDFRGHGESQYGPCAGGYTEDQDVVGAVDYAFRRIAREAPGEAPRVGVVGFGLGACAAISAIGRVRGDARTIRVFSADGTGSTGFVEFQAENIKRLRFLVAIEPASQRMVLGETLREIVPPLRRVLGPLLIPVVDRFYRSGSGYPLDGRLLRQFAEQVYTPMLLVGRADADHAKRRELQQIYEAAPGPKQAWWINGPVDGLAVHDHVVAHPERVTAFALEQLEREAGG
jgi:alpha/beta superfamily hydrolase